MQIFETEESRELPRWEGELNRTGHSPNRPDRRTSQPESRLDIFKHIVLVLVHTRFLHLGVVLDLGRDLDAGRVQ